MCRDTSRPGQQCCGLVSWSAIVLDPGVHDQHLDKSGLECFVSRLGGYGLLHHPLAFGIVDLGLLEFLGSGSYRLL